MKKNIICNFILLVSIVFVSCKKTSSHTVKVGLLHSLTCTLAISEVAVSDAELLAIKDNDEQIKDRSDLGGRLPRSA